MAKLALKRRKPASVEPRAVAEITVSGFKSIGEETSIEIRPLTILAGVNSSGKSSIMQPLLLLKQTLEASYDPGTLLLNGPNVKFTSADQLLARIGKRLSSDIFHVGLKLNSGEFFQSSFQKEHRQGFRIEQQTLSGTIGTVTLWPGMTQSEIVKAGVPTDWLDLEAIPEGHRPGEWEIMRERCFLEPAWVARAPDGTSLFQSRSLASVWARLIPELIHLPGLRGNPERTYPVTAAGPSYPGTFEKYTASVISQWMAEGEKLHTRLGEDLQLMRLAGGVTAAPVNAAQIELQVGRLPDVAPTRPEERVNIADVGVGVSQTLPVLVALHAANPGRLVYVEQPETHLHPRAQFVLAQVLAQAANRGVRVVVETHSSLLLLGVQTMVAEGKLRPDQVCLHWFERDKSGRTIVRSGDLDDAGRFGDWPEDFDDVTLGVQKRYLDAADKRLFAQ